MYGKWVTVHLGDNIRCQVYVFCSPDATYDELQERAKQILRNKLGEPKKGIWALGDNLRIIEEFDANIL